MWSAERFIARSQRSRRMVANLAIVLAVGITAAIAISLIAGARRSASVVDRFFASAPTYDVRIGSSSPAFEPDAVSALPGVARADPTPYMAFVPDNAPARAGVNTIVRDFSVPNLTMRVLHGRLPRAENEAVVNQALVDQFGIRVGDRLGARTFAVDQYDDISSGVYTPRGPHYEFTIVGVIRTPEDIAVDVARAPRNGAATKSNEMILPTQFWIDHRHEFVDFGKFFDVRLTAGAAGVDQFVDAARQLSGDGATFFTSPWDVSDRKAAFTGPVSVESNALLGVGIGAAIGALGIALLLIRLEQRRFDDEHEAMAAIGISTGGLAAVAVLRVLPAVVATAALAIGGAVLLSPRYPIGIGRLLELNSGADINVAVLALAAAAIVVVPLGFAALFAVRVARRRETRPTRPAALWSSTHVPLHAALGGRLALGAGDRQRRSSSVTGIGAAIVTIAAALTVCTWLSGTQRVYETPAIRGWLWDVAIGNVNFPLDPQTQASLAADPRVGASTAVGYGQATLDGVSTEILAFDRAGTAPPKIISGRLPASPSEAALGEGMMRTLHHKIGDTVTLSLAGSEFVDDESQTVPVTLTIVGESVSPVFGESDVADVAVVPLDAIAAGGANSDPRIVLIDVNGTDRAATVAALVADHTEESLTDVIPSRVVNLHRVRAVPIAGLLLAFMLGLVALASTIFAAQRANRHAVVVLAAIGIDDRGRRRVIWWHGVIVAATVLVVAIPLGLLADVTWWRRQTNDLGLRVSVPAPADVLVPLVVCALAVAVALAFIAGRRFRPPSIAAGLRSE